jgi:hypothetical protein
LQFAAQHFFNSYNSYIQLQEKERQQAQFLELVAQSLMEVQQGQVRVTLLLPAWPARSHPSCSCMHAARQRWPLQLDVCWRRKRQVTHALISIHVAFVGPGSAALLSCVCRLCPTADFRVML